MFHCCAHFAVIRIIRGLPVPTSSGNGDCTGLGRNGASRIVKFVPSNDTRSSVNRRLMISIPSSKRSTRSFGSGRSQP